MNNNNELIHDSFVDVIEWLEKYIEKSNYYSNWKERKQIHHNSITRSDINSFDATRVKRSCSSALFGLKVTLGLRENKSFPKSELKKEFFQWIDAIKIKVDDCPTELISLLYHTHEVLEGRGDELRNQVMRKSDQEISKMSKEEREKGWSNFHSEVMKQYQKIENGETDKARFNPNGSAKQGQKTFEKIVATISNYDLFPENEITPDDSLEAQVAIKELEGLLEWTKVDIEKDPKLLEKTIQKLEDFESNEMENGGKNNYAWVKLGAGGKLTELKIIKLNQERKLFPTKSNLQNSSDNSAFFLMIVVISVIFISSLVIIIYLEKRKNGKKVKKSEP